ncbi:Smr/MutS family protein [Desulfobacter vibrioformis]|uniref:Smr/MutS family protein n=1 Tax=Desulfobacter vibrioformis TaxID=34031 RepID=UPI000556454B|nr:Smr/MutS family protein [Desulfobacter vibrioformis]
MTNKNIRKNKQKLKRKNDLPKLASDKDFLSAFLRDEQEASADKTAEQAPADTEPEADFSTLLEAFLKQNCPPRHAPKPMPLKRRLKRYPPPEADLDLHGFTAIGARVKTRSFISNAHVQGFFTLRIIVGKGLHSEGGPVLPHVVEDLLKEMKKENIVLAYEWEGRKKSKSGSVLVYLKRFDD